MTAAPRNENVLEDDGFRFVDVLLEEELARAEAGDALVSRGPGVVRASGETTPRRARRAGHGARRWLVAAFVLLGVTTVAAVGLLQRLDSGEAQDPQRTDPPGRGERFEPRGLDDLERFLSSAATVHLQGVDGNPKGLSYLECAPVPGNEATAVGERLSGLRGAWQLVAPAATFSPAARVAVTGADGRVLVAWLCGERVQTGGMTLAPPRAARGLFASLMDAAGFRAKATARVAADDAALHATPATTEWLRCGSVSLAALQQVLPRLTRLRTLHVVACGDQVAAAVSMAPTLEELHVAETWLGDPGVRTLARLPKLRRLELVRQPQGTGVPSLRGLTGLRALSVRAPLTTTPDARPDAAQLAWLRELATLPLEELELALPHPTPELVDALGPIVSMPTLSALALVPTGGDASALAFAVATTPLRRLRLGGASLAPAALSALASMPALKELSLRGTFLQPEHLPVLQRFRALDRLDVMDTGLDEVARDSLVATLPGAVLWANALTYLDAEQVAVLNRYRALGQNVTFHRPRDNDAGATFLGPSWSRF